MIIFDYNGKCIEILRNNFNTDIDYYARILEIKYKILIPKPRLTVDEICQMI